MKIACPSEPLFEARGVSSTEGVRDGLEEVDPSDEEAAASNDRLDNGVEIFLTLDRVLGTRFFPDVTVGKGTMVVGTGVG